MVLAWAVLTILGGLGALEMAGHLQGDSWVLPETESGRVDARLAKAFGWDASRIDMAVFQDPTRQVESPGFRAEATAMLGRLQEASGVAQVVSYYQMGDRRLISPDGHTTYALVLYRESAESLARTLPEYRARLQATGSLRAVLTGRSSFSYDLDRASQEDLHRLETTTLPLIFVLLLVVFGSFTSAMLPLALGGMTVMLTMGALALWRHVEPQSTFAPNTASMIGLGLGIDFSLLLVNRFREELRSHAPLEALQRTLPTAGRSVLYSGLTLSAGMAVVYVLAAQISLLRSLTAAIIMVALLAVVGALTLLPALLAFLGPRVGLNAERAAKGEERGRRWAHGVMRHPWRWVVLGVLVLGTLALPMVQMKRGFPDMNAIDRHFPSRQGLALLRDAFGVGELNPIYASIHTPPRGVWKREFRAGLRDWTARLEQDPRVQRVDSWAGAVGPERLMRLSPFGLAFDPLAQMHSAPWVNLMGAADTTMVRIIPRGEVESPEVRQLVLDLRADRGTRELGGQAEVLIGGMPGNAIDFVDQLYGRFPAMIVGIMLVTFVTLLVFLRSLWLPIKAVVITGLSVASCYGILVMVFQHGWGAPLIGLTPPGHLTAIIPVLLFGVLFGLSTDYEVFLLTRVRELHLAGATNDEAVAGGLAITGRIITAAAAVMVGVFATFAYSGVTVIQEIGVGLTLGVLLDATLVRVIMAPAIMRLLGRWNWWLPPWLERWLPRVSHGEPAPEPVSPPR